MESSSLPRPEFKVICLCADWCATCREFQPIFDKVAAELGQVSFHWVDVETHSDWADGIDIETFPTLAVFREDLVLHYGPTYPKEMVYSRTLTALLDQSREESEAYVRQDALRHGWQTAPEIVVLRGAGLD